MRTEILKSIGDRLKLVKSQEKQEHDYGSRVTGMDKRIKNLAAKHKELSQKIDSSTSSLSAQFRHLEFDFLSINDFQKHHKMQQAQVESLKHLLDQAK